MEKPASFGLQLGFTNKLGYVTVWSSHQKSSLFGTVNTYKSPEAFCTVTLALMPDEQESGSIHKPIVFA